MVNLHLSKFKVNLVSDGPGLIPSCRTIRVISESNDSDVIAYIRIDERKYNTIAIMNEIGENVFKNPNPILDFIRSEFHKFKKSNPSYGDFEDGYDKLYGYEGTIPLYVEDFFNYLKAENRDILISDILQNEK